jgi:hypothetical protein
LFKYKKKLIYVYYETFVKIAFFNLLYKLFWSHLNPKSFLSRNFCICKTFVLPTMLKRLSFKRAFDRAITWAAEAS